MSSRTYLSIGDVLSLLREEFPDVTISKIRFLESQGLVNPERSPSGYRKFFETDVERLRWVLRQQRENFLPLKVIRDRLANEDGVPTEDIEIDEHTMAMVANGASEELTPERVMALVASSLTAEPALKTAEAEPAAPRVPSVREAPAKEAAPVAVSESSLVEASAPMVAVTAPPSLAKPVNAPPRAPEQAGTVRPVVAAIVGHVNKERPAAPKHAAAAKPTKPAPTESEARPAPAPRVAAKSEAAPTTTSIDLTGASLTIDELCAATGLSVTDIAAIEGFGLIESMTVAGIFYYDEEALTVAKLAADFAHFGIEPRHLRQFRNSVDRELGLIEQIITPLLRQRNPEARQRAVDSSTELARLGASLRGSILRKELRRQLGG